MKTKLLSYLIFICMVYLPQHSISQVIYTDLNPDILVIDSGPGSTWNTCYYQQFYSDSKLVDLNNDGIYDFQFNFLWTDTFLFGISQIFKLDVTSLGNNSISSENSFGICAKRYSWGDMIDTNLNYFTTANLYYDEYVPPQGCNTHTGNWQGIINDGFLAVKFEVSGQFYLGWIRMSMVSILPKSYIIQDYAYESNGNVILAGDGMSTGINEFDKSDKVIIYPNPSNDFVNINLPTEITATNNHFDFIISDTQGRCVKAFYDVKNNFRIDVRSFEKGIYFYSWVNKDRKINSGKIAIQ